MKKGIFVISMVVLMYSCKSKNKSKNENDGFFPVISFIQSQVAQIDTSVYPLLKIVKRDTLIDSSYIKREEFRTYAQDFLTLPDIASKKLQDKYTETKMYDESLNSVMLDYTATDPEAEVRREEVIIEPDAQRGDQVKTIYIDRLMNKGDSMVQKRLMWRVNKRFQVVTIVQKQGQPDKVETMEVVWNDFEG
ncbi:MAG: hypothetical protein ICV81_01640 [Flavisolibacter sp.]|nr:hypothetical protein [Flavisolibacter sp.]